MFEMRAPAPAARACGHPHPRLGQHRPVHDAGHGRRKPRAQSATGPDGWCGLPAGRPALSQEAPQRLAGRDVRFAAVRSIAVAAAGGQAARRADLLYRRDQRAPGGARPGADPARTPGPPIWFRTPDKEDRTDSSTSISARCPMRPSSTSTPARRASPPHLRVFAGDDRAGLLTRADRRPVGAPQAVTSGRPRRGDDDRRVRDRGRHRVSAQGDTGRRDPRGGHALRHDDGGRPLHPALDSQAGARSAIIRPSRWKSSLSQWREEEFAPVRVGAGSDGG